MTLLGWLAEHGPRLLLGATLVLGLGALLTALVRDPASRRRSGLWTAGLSALYLGGAIAPLPRLSIAPLVEPIAPPAATSQLDAALAVLADEQAVRLPTALVAPEPATPNSIGTARTDAAPPADRSIDWVGVLGVGYLAGGAIAALWWLFGAARLARVLRVAHPAPTPLALPPRTRLLTVDGAIRPFCCGLVRAAIVVPRSLLASERRTQLAAVLRHEAAHARARDPLAQALLSALGVLLWCHPLFWWLRGDVRFQSELCADDAASSGARTAYARDLLDLVDHAGTHPSVPDTVAVFHRPSDFARRIQMLLQPKTASPLPPTRRRRIAQALALCALTATAVSTLGVPLPAQDPQRDAVQAECNRLRTEIAQLKDELALLKAQAAAAGADAGGFERTPAGLPGAAAPAAANDPRQKPGVPVLKDIPIVSNFFRNPGDASAGAPDDIAVQGLQPGSYPAFPSRANDSSTLDATADLASRVIDLDSELDVTRAELERLKPMAEAGVASTTDLRKTEVRLRALERKKAIVQKLVRGEIAATESEMQWLLRRKKEADKTEDLRIDSQLQRANAKLEALRAVN